MLWATEAFEDKTPRVQTNEIATKDEMHEVEFANDYDSKRNHPQV
jgi:hypothetical protein